MRQDIGYGVLDFLFDKLCFGLADRKIVAFALIMVKNQQENNGAHGQNNGEQRRACLREGFIRGRGTGQTDDFGIDGIVPQQGRRRHGAQACDKSHDSQRKQRGEQRRHDNAKEYLEGFGAKIAGGFHGVVVNSADGVAQEKRMI